MDETAPCPGCSKPVPIAFKNVHCPDCLKQAMDNMTEDDWKRELGAIFENIGVK